MLEHSLFQSHFIGRDGFRWWIGQIAPDEVNADQTKYKKGWGIRYKVRIMGYHPYNVTDLPDEDLPWAQVLLPPGYGTGSGGLYKTVRFQQGDTVVGFFLDGDNGQIPVIFGAFGNSKYRAEEGAVLPFRPYTGFTETLPEPTKNVKKKSNHIDASDPPKQPRNLSPKQAKEVSKVDGNEAFYNTSVGKTIHIATGESQTSDAINKMKTGVEGLVRDVENMKLDIDSGIPFSQDRVSEMIGDKVEALSGVSSGMVAGMTNNLYTAMAPQLGLGLDMLYDSVYKKVLAATQSPTAANFAGIASQESMLGPVSKIEELLPCIVNKVSGNLKDSLKGILGSVVDNVFNYNDCVGDQATGALINSVIAQLSDGMEDVLGGVSKILQFLGDFSVDNVLRNGINALLGMAGLGDCNLTPSPSIGASKYRLGYGPISGGEPPLDKIMKDANAAKAVSQAARIAGFPLDSVQDLMGGFSLLSGGISDAASGLTGEGGGSPCSAAEPTSCNPPEIRIFGGGGSGAKAIPLFGNIINGTGSIIGIKVVDGGSGYEFPPFVEIIDNCRQGYGAVARSIIENGKVVSIYIVAEGLNYPITDMSPPIVNTVTVINPGSDYSDEDYVVDQLGNEYDTKIYAGSIIKITPINSQDINEIPILSVVSSTGSGAVLKANLDARPEFQGEIQNIIDCVNT